MSSDDRYWTIGDFAIFSGHGNKFGFPNPTGIQLIHHYSDSSISFLRCLWNGSELFCPLIISYEGFIGFQLLELPWFSILCFVISFETGDIDFNIGPLHWNWLRKKWEFPWTYFS